MNRRDAAGLLLFAFALSVATVAHEVPVRYDNFKAVKAHPATWDQVEYLHGIGAILLSCHEGPAATDYAIPPGAMAELELSGIPYKVLDHNIQAAIDAERARLSRAAAVLPNDPQWFTDFRTFQEIEAQLNQWVIDRPDLATLVDIGDSIEGRDIWALRITAPGGTGTKPAILFNGTQHAREWISPMVNMYIADQLIDAYDTDPEIQALLGRLEVIIVPVVNPDGYVYTQINRLWRKNRRNNGTSCYGVDTNRNWATGWGGPGSGSSTCDETYRGALPFSEPETQALRDFFLANPQIVANIDYHSYSQLILSPYGYTNNLPPDNDLFLTLGEAMHNEIFAVHDEYYEWGPIAPTLYQASGGSIDWVYDVAGAYAFTIELRPTSSFPGFQLPPGEIIPTCEENWPAAMYFANWASYPVALELPSGLPARLVPETPTTVPMKFSEISGVVDPNAAFVYTRFGSHGDFTATPLTAGFGDQYVANLPPTLCGTTLEWYFQVDTVGGMSATFPPDAPATVYSANAAPISVVLDEPLDTNPGWATQGQWAHGQPTGQGGQYGDPDPTSGFTGPNVYGYNLNGDYPDNMSQQHLTSTSIDCSNATGVTLGFYRWLGVEQPLYDHAYVRVSGNGGVNWDTVWSNPDTISDNGWKYVEYDISQYADGRPNVQLRWTMGASDGGWRYCGWNIDDIQVFGANPAGCDVELRCAGDSDCNGRIDFDDISHFVRAIGDDGTEWATGYANAHGGSTPPCDFLNNDMDGDADCDFDDISGFVNAIGSTCDAQMPEACCFGGGGCTWLRASDCLNQGGVLAGAYTTCADVSCD
jgi:murein tripeptide amidase MpaA